MVYNVYHTRDVMLQNLTFESGSKAVSLRLERTALTHSVILVESNRVEVVGS